MNICFLGKRNEARRNKMGFVENIKDIFKKEKSKKKKKKKSKWKCKYCKEQFKTEKIKLTHEDYCEDNPETKSREYKFKCEKCQKRFEFEEIYNLHKTRCGKTQKKETKRKKCKFCNIFVKKHKLSKHELKCSKNPKNKYRYEYSLLNIMDENVSEWIEKFNTGSEIKGLREEIKEVINSKFNKTKYDDVINLYNKIKKEQIEKINYSFNRINSLFYSINYLKRNHSDISRLEKIKEEIEKVEFPINANKLKVIFEKISDILERIEPISVLLGRLEDIGWRSNELIKGRNAVDVKLNKIKRIHF